VTISSVTKPLVLIKRLALLLVALVIGLFAWVLLRLPDPQVFNANVERIFVETDLSSQAEIKLLEVLAASGSLFEESIGLYTQIITALLILCFALLLVALGLLILNLDLRARNREAQARTLSVNQIRLNRAESFVQINDQRFKLTASNLETLAVLLEARLDDEYLSGASLEAIVSGKTESQCEEAAGAVRIKRLRDQLGNQLVS
jgi:hypothetical protein